jgi:UDP-glucuronate 4-epimerase
MKILVTGAAGFIGAHTALKLLAAGHEVVGIDNLNPYYEVSLKEARLGLLACPRFRFERLDITDEVCLARLFEREGFERVVHLAAQAGVRHSLTEPRSYVQSNVLGMLNVLEGCRHTQVAHLVYASSSSVYGANTDMPYCEHRSAAHPLSLYGATKRADELMAHSYSALFALPTTGLRFFTVYGPWGRPDMALFIFTRAMLEGPPIEVYNGGRHRRDFTYIDDIVAGVVGVLERIPTGDPAWNPAAPDPATSFAPFRLYNIGNHQPVPLMRYIEVLEETLKRKAQITLLPLQPGDVPETYADVDDLVRDVGYRPATRVEEGVPRFVDWFCDYYRYERP